MVRAETVSEAQDVATKALTFLGEQKLAPTPNNYTVAYVYYSSGNPKLCVRIDELRAAGGICAEEMEKLYDTFFGIDAESEAIRTAGLAVEGILANVRRAVGDAGMEAASYGRALQDFSAEVDGHGSTGDLGQTMARILNETEKMRARNAELEDEFAKSSDEMAELRRNLNEMRHAAETDSLTGIANRKHFDATLKEMIEESCVADEPLALIMADIDHFKRFNDKFGHQVGDHVLRLVSLALTQSVRGRDFVARYGGEEFAVILPQTGLSGAMAVAENIREAIASKRLTRKTTGELLGMITLSLGVAQYRHDEDPDQLVKRADDGLYRAKNEGRNRSVTVDGAGPQPLRSMAPLAG